MLAGHDALGYTARDILVPKLAKLRYFSTKQGVSEVSASEPVLLRPHRPPALALCLTPPTPFHIFPLSSRFIRCNKQQYLRKSLQPRS